MSSPATWGDFAAAEADLAAFGVGRLTASPAYLATVGPDGNPRVHPVTPIPTAQALFVFMEPTSPKGRDLRRGGGYALHNGVPDMSGTGGEFLVRGIGRPVDDPAIRAAAVAAASYDVLDRYELYELLVSEARCNGYGDVTLPARTRWKAAGS